jgi:hypothetical protein
MFGYKAEGETMPDFFNHAMTTVYEMGRGHDRRTPRDRRGKSPVTQAAQVGDVDHMAALLIGDLTIVQERDDMQEDVLESAAVTGSVGTFALGELALTLLAKNINSRHVKRIRSALSPHRNVLRKEWMKEKVACEAIEQRIAVSPEESPPKEEAAFEAIERRIGLSAEERAGTIWTFFASQAIPLSKDGHLIWWLQKLRPPFRLSPVPAMEPQTAIRERNFPTLAASLAEHGIEPEVLEDALRDIDELETDWPIAAIAVSIRGAAVGKLPPDAIRSPTIATLRRLQEFQQYETGHVGDWPRPFPYKGVGPLLADCSEEDLDAFVRFLVDLQR